MRGILSAFVLVCVTTLVGLSVFAGPSQLFRLTGLGGTDVILVPAGDDGVGGH